MPGYSAAVLAAAAGTDPWALRQRLGSGDADALRGAGLQFRLAGRVAAEAAEHGRRADRAAAEAFRVDGATAFDAVASSARGAVLLADRGEKMEETARALIEIAAALDEHGGRAAGRLATLEADLQRIAALRNSFFVDDVVAVTAELRFQLMAVDAVRAAGRTIQAEVDAYDAVLANRAARFAAMGYGPPDDDDGGLLPAVADGAAEIVEGTYDAAGELADGAAGAATTVAGGIAAATGAIVGGVAAGDPLGGLGRAATEIGAAGGRAVGQVADGLERAAGEIGSALDAASQDEPLDRLPAPERERLINELILDSNEKFRVTPMNAEAALRGAPPGTTEIEVKGPGGEGADIVFRDGGDILLEREVKSTLGNENTVSSTLSKAATQLSAGDGEVWIQVAAGTDVEAHIRQFQSARADLGKYENVVVSFRDPDGVALGLYRLGDRLPPR